MKFWRNLNRKNLNYNLYFLKIIKIRLVPEKNKTISGVNAEKNKDFFFNFVK